MTHLIDKDAKVQKIREEVERLKSQLLRGACSSQIAMETSCKEEAYNEVLAMLDTLQEEQLTRSVTKTSDQEEPVSEDLEEAAEKYAHEAYSHPVDRNVGKADFITGAKWQKEQIMAKAIDGKVIANGMGNPILHLWDKGRHLIDKKVKVIVIKGD